MGAEDARQQRYLQDLCAGMAGVRKPVIAALEGLAVSTAAPHFPRENMSAECKSDSLMTAWRRTRACLDGRYPRSLRIRPGLALALLTNMVLGSAI